MLAEHGPDAALYAGGTELLLLMKAGFVRPRVLLDIKHIAGLDAVSAENGAVEIGATVSHRMVERSPVLRERCPLVANVARHVANVRVRAVGTVGGNIAFADPHSDLATLFLVFDAAVAVWSLRGERMIPLADFVVGPYETARRDDEILTRVRLATWPTGAAGAYLKFGVHERPTLGVAAVLIPAGDGRQVAEARVAIGCIGPRPQRLAAIEADLRGTEVADLAAGRIDCRDEQMEAIDAMTDLHGAADYKRAMAQVYVRRALQLAAARATGKAMDPTYPYTVAA